MSAISLGMLASLELTSPTSFAASKNVSHLSNLSFYILKTAIQEEPNYLQAYKTHKIQFDFLFNKNDTAKQDLYLLNIINQKIDSIYKAEDQVFIPGIYKNGFINYSYTWMSKLYNDLPTNSSYLFGYENTTLSYNGFLQSYENPYYDLASYLGINNNQQTQLFTNIKIANNKSIYTGKTPSGEWVNMSIFKVTNNPKVDHSVVEMIVTKKGNKYVLTNEAFNQIWNVPVSVFFPNNKLATKLVKRVTLQFILSEKFTYNQVKVSQSGTVTSSVYGS